MSQNGLTQTGQDEDAALEWIAKFRSAEVSAQERQEFALWLAAEPGRRKAMDRMLELWDDLGTVRQLPFPVNAPDHGRRRLLGASLAAAAAVILAVLLLPLVGDQASPQVYQTAIGERLSIELDDDSSIMLNTNSRIRVRYSRHQRELELLKGEAFFKVAKDPARPFHVDAGSARVTAIGTAFNIFRRRQGSAITVTEGVVRVTELGATGNRVPDTDVLHTNFQLLATTNGLEPSAPADIEINLAWQRGELVAHNMPLPELVAELERYHDTRILIGDSATAAETVSGIFQLDHPQSNLEALQRSHGLKVVQLDEHTVQLLKSPQ